jgi:hypothetical protein
VEEVTAEAAEEEATAEVGEAVAAEDMIVAPTADKTGTADPHQLKKVKKSMSP